MLSTRYIDDSSTAVLASTIGHEGEHDLIRGKYKGQNLWMAEQSATRMQIGIGQHIGFTPDETEYYRNYSDSQNRQQMQEHMEKGLRY